MPKARRRGTRFVALAIFFAVLAVAVPALGDDGTAGIPLSPPPPSDSGGGEGSAGSPTGYPNASEAQAENLFTDNFSATVDSLASDPPDLSGEHPEFLNNRTAVTSPAGPPAATVDQIQAALARDAHDAAAAQADVAAILDQADSGDDDPARLVASTLPLRTPDASGQPAPVDLSLDPQGSSYQPQNPLVDLSLPDTITHEVAVGDQGLKVDVGASDPASADPIAGDNLFYADAAQATDVVLAPISTGLETLYQLRAPSSPDQFQMTLTLPDGASLSPAGDGGAQITSDGQTLAAIYPPSATDAAGNPVPVSMTVDGDQLDLEVPHSDPSIQYPISVDPAIDTYSWSSNGAGTFSDWIQNKTVGSPYQLKTTCTQNVNCTSGTTGPAGLYVAVPQNSSVTAQSVGSWQYRVPHYGQTTAYISNLNLGPMYFANRGDTNANPFLFAGIYDDNGSYTASQGQTSNALNLYWSLDPGTLKTGKQGVFALWSWSNRQLTQWRDAYLGGATVTLGDRESPVIPIDGITDNGLSYNSAGYSDWVDNATATIKAAATDQAPANANAGLGINRFQFLLPESSGGVQNRYMLCSGANASPCPQSATSPAVSYDTSGMPNGVTLIAVIATDPMSNADVRLRSVRVDHARPRISLSGGLAPGGSGGAYTLHIDATDGDTSSEADWQSGVRQITLNVNGDPVSLSGAGPQNCTRDAGSCPLSVDYTLQPSDYTTQNLHFTVDATDELGHHALGAGGQSLDWTVPFPDTSIDSGPSGPTNDTTPTFNYSSPDSSATFQCRIDQDAFAPCGISGFTRTTELAQGAHTFDVRAVDTDGHRDPTPASQQFLVDTTDPTLDVSGDFSNGAPATVGEYPEVDVDVTDAQTSAASVELLIDGTQVDELTTDDCDEDPCAFHDSFNPDLGDLAPGGHSYSIVATDAAGNSVHQNGTLHLDPTPPHLALVGELVDSDGEPLSGSAASASIQASDDSSGDTGVARIEVSVDDTVDATDTPDCAPSCPNVEATDYIYERADWGLGPHDVRVTATDAAGNTETQTMETDVPPPRLPAECPQVSQTAQDAPDPLSTDAAKAAAPNWSVAASTSAYDSEYDTNVDPSLSQPDDSPPTPLQSEDTLSYDDVASNDNAQVQLDDVACLVPTQTTSEAKPAALAAGDSAIYANTATDTDTVIRPTSSGETIVENLRSADSTRDFSWKVGVEEGDQLQQLASGAIAIVQTDEPAPAGLTVPSQPDNLQDSDAIHLAAAQLDAYQYEVSAAEQETGKSVDGVLAPPYGIDSSGAVVQASLTLDNTNTVTLHSPAGASQVVDGFYSNAKKTNGLPFVKAFYIHAANGKDARHAVTSAVCNGYKPRKKILEHRVLMLDFGIATHLHDKVFGALAGPAKGALNNDKIFTAMRAGAIVGSQGPCNIGRVAIGYGNNNAMGDHIQDDGTAGGAGKYQARTAERLNQWLNSQVPEQPYMDEEATIGGDIEMGYDGPNKSKALANGAATEFGAGHYYDYGNAAGCPPVNGDGPGCLNNWTLDGVASVSYGQGARPLPEIYCNHPDNAQQWANVAQHGQSSYHFAGITSEADGYGLTPGKGWNHLNHVTNRFVGTEVIRFPFDEERHPNPCSL
jgi:hypothetical protein